MLAGTSTTIVLQIWNHEYSNVWDAPQEGPWYSSSSNCVRNISFNTHRKKKTAGERLKMKYFPKKMLLILLRQEKMKGIKLFLWPNCSCASYAASFSVNIQLAQTRLNRKFASRSFLLIDGVFNAVHYFCTEAKRDRGLLHLTCMQTFSLSTFTRTYTE